MGTPKEYTEDVPGVYSLRLRLLGLVILFTVVSMILLEFYTLRQFEKATTLEIEHEGMVLSNLLEAIILPELEAGDIAAIQDQIDRFVAKRTENDIEINIIRLRRQGSDIVASNNPGNIEETDEEEHEDVLFALHKGTPTIYVDRDVDDSDPDDEPTTGMHPDQFLRVGERFLAITTPLIGRDRNLGGINMKLSMASLDEELYIIRLTLITAAGVQVIFIVLGLGFLMHRKVFQPLYRMRNDMHHVAAGDLNRQVPAAGRRDEIGLLAQAFNSMARQLARTQAQLHQYLNPNAIEEAYRRAGESQTEALAVEREISVLFVDIVSFTTMSERLGPTGTVAYLNRFYDLITAALIDTGGYIDKFVADEAVCVFDGADHADKAVTAARGILDLLHSHSDDEPARARVGINTGTCIVADIGSEQFGRLDRTIIGDTVNVAQRLMAAAEPNTARFSEFTYKALKNPAPDITPVGGLRLKGKTTEVMAYQLSPSPENGENKTPETANRQS